MLNPKSFNHIKLIEIHFCKTVKWNLITDTSRRASKSIFETIKSKISDTIDDVQDFFDGDDDKNEENEEKEDKE